jgi:DNA polymerase-3 subunit gamma/tau
VGHAYLFCGPRGVGKTTLARVLAMALNCPTRTPEGEPCGECESCSRIWGGHTALDVVEIDAASNRGVDDARELRARAQYAPSDEGRYKVYILDEAHMLTREAWNALLKVLEEPPPRVIFVFATTEPQKIQQSAAPILSRCQRFDFRRIGVADIVERLSEVLRREGTEGPDDALRTIARKADGGMRDALSLLDQVMALTGGQVSQEAVRQILGLVEEERYVELIDILMARQTGRIFAFVDRLVADGYDLVEFYHGLVEAIRLLLRIRLEGSSELSDVREDLRDGFRDRAERCDPVDLVRMLALAAELETSGSLRRSVQPRMLVEMLLLRLAFLDRTVDLEELLRGLGGAPADVESPGGSSATSAGSTASVPPEAALSPPAPTDPESQPSMAGGNEDSLASNLSAAAETSEEGVSEHDGEGSASGLQQPETAEPRSPTGDPAVAWTRLLDQGAGLPGGLVPFMRAAVVRSGSEGQVEVSLPPGPGLDRLREPLVRAAVERALHRHLVDRPQLVVVATEAAADASRRITPETVREGRLRELIEREPLLGKAVQELDLELLD